MPEEETNMWWRKLGFYTNPFTIKPAVFDTKVFGQDSILEDLNYKIPAGTLSFIEGPLGTGKTTLLKHLISKFRGKGKLIFFSCNRIETDLNIEDLLKGKYGFWGKLFGLMPNDMIVLLDEAQQLTSVNTERVKYFFDQGNIKSVIFTGTDYDKIDLHDSIKDRIGTDGLFKINELTEDEVLSLVRNRIGNTKIISDDIIKKLWKDSNKNPRRLLQKLDKVFRYAVENMESEIKESQLKAIFEKKPEEKPAKPEPKPEPESEPEPTPEKPPEAEEAAEKTEEKEEKPRKKPGRKKKKKKED